jgi:hypothetical protein
LFNLFICIISHPDSEAICCDEDCLLAQVLEILSSNPASDDLFQWAFMLVNKVCFLLVFINLVGLMVHFVVFCSSANLLSKTEQQ